MSIYGIIFYGTFFENLGEIFHSIPQLKRNFKIKDGMSEIQIRNLVNHQMIQNQSLKNKFQFRFKIKNKIESIFLGIFVLVSLGKQLKYYFGIELANCELEEPWRIEEIKLLPHNKKKVIEKVFKKYKLGTPKMFIIESFI